MSGVDKYFNNEEWGKFFFFDFAAVRNNQEAAETNKRTLQGTFLCSSR